MSVVAYETCPICHAPDMRTTLDSECNKLIHCTNHACRSNGGDYDVSHSVKPKPKVKLKLSAVGATREEAMSYALQALAHAAGSPQATGQRIANAFPSMYAPSAWVDYRFELFEPESGEPTACA